MARREYRDTHWCDFRLMAVDIDPRNGGDDSLDDLRRKHGRYALFHRPTVLVSWPHQLVSALDSPVHGRWAHFVFSSA
jgi:hypothetical protein